MIELREIVEGQGVLLEAGESLIGIEPAFDKLGMAVKWYAVVEMPDRPCQVIDLSKYREANDDNA